MHLLLLLCWRVALQLSRHDSEGTQQCLLPGCRCCLLLPVPQLAGAGLLLHWPPRSPPDQGWVGPEHHLQHPWQLRQKASQAQALLGVLPLLLLLLLLSRLSCQLGGRHVR